jgi:hypothetical protein
VFKPNKMIPLVLQKEAVRAMKKFFSRAQALKGLVRGDMHNFVVKGYGNHLIRKWEHFNKKYYYQLKHELYEELNERFTKITERFKHRRIWD